MKDETKKWLDYANENLQSAQLLAGSLFNPCLQNVQQAVEKVLKALLVESGIKFFKTHSITELVSLLVKNGKNINITPDDCDLLDSVYLPSKYPLGGVLPDFEPDEEICKKCLEMAERIFESVEKHLR
ncbi:MAG: HEPN domain-containing protein [Phycisphaerae bacterium]|jgi:HEPN domain-containing protein